MNPEQHFEGTDTRAPGGLMDEEFNIRNGARERRRQIVEIEIEKEIERGDRANKEKNQKNKKH